MLFPRIVSIRNDMKIPNNQDQVRLDGSWAKSMLSFVKMKVRKGQSARVPEIAWNRKCTRLLKLTAIPSKVSPMPPRILSSLSCSASSIQICPLQL